MKWKNKIEMKDVKIYKETNQGVKKGIERYINKGKAKKLK
jgi:hypothetical protein